MAPSTCRCFLAPALSYIGTNEPQNGPRFIIRVSYGLPQNGLPQNGGTDACKTPTEHALATHNSPLPFDLPFLLWCVSLNQAEIPPNSRHTHGPSLTMTTGGFAPLCCRNSINYSAFIGGPEIFISPITLVSAPRESEGAHHTHSGCCMYFRPIWGHTFGNFLLHITWPATALTISRGEISGRKAKVETKNQIL